MTAEEIKAAKTLEANQDHYCFGRRWTQAIGSNIGKEWFDRIQCEMVEVDLIAAQANLLIKAIESAGGKELRESTRKSDFEDFINYHRIKKGYSKLSWNAFVKDCEKYKKFVMQFPDVYSAVRDQINEENEDPNTDLTREQIKEQFGYFISKVDYQGPKIPLCGWMKENFETLYEFLCDVKFYGQQENTPDRFKLHNRLFSYMGNIFKIIIRKVQDKIDTPYIYRYDGLWIKKCDMKFWIDALKSVAEKYKLPIKKYHIKYNSFSSLLS